ncbi:MAG: hypothetical protein OSA11_07530 [Candidatus Nanopelagicales bacterium]|nr:hypothetical protein [Candidatus Nanopelagicales bacterium]
MWHLSLLWAVAIPAAVLGKTWATPLALAAIGFAGLHVVFLS